MARRLFLERRTYRQNRLQDAARLLPVLGAVLVFAPVFIRGEATGAAGPDLADWLVYYFAVWTGLIALTAFVSRALTRGGGAQAPRAPSGFGSDPGAVDEGR